MLTELGLQLVKHDLPFRLNHVNCFVAEGIDGLTVIDTGLHNKQTANRWDKELAGKKVTDILISHYHPDHFGYAGGLQQKHNARVLMSEIDVNAGLTAWQDHFLEKSDLHYTLAGIPKETGQAMASNTAEFIAAVTPYPTIDSFLKDGEKIVLGNYEYTVVFTPGHSDGLVTFFNEEKKVLLSTDHILPRITPNISYWFHGDPNPLQTYIESLNKVKQLNANLVIPSHGKPFYGANKRIDEIIAHHEERLEVTLDAIKRNSTVYDICQKLFPMELTIHETRFAIGETISHLEYLRNKSEIKRETLNNEWVYTI